MKKVKSRISLKLKSLNQEKKLNRLCKSVKLYNIERESKAICKIEVENCDYKKLKALLKEEDFEVLEVHKKGAVNILKKVFSSWGIIFACIFAVVTFCIQYNFVWQFKIDGLEKLSKEEIASCLNENMSTRFKKNIDVDKLEIALKDRFERISAVSVAIIGQTLAVNISEAYIPDEMLGDFKPIVSDCDGVITDIDLVQGTLAVKRGDIVRKGDVLVHPYIIDTDGEKREVKPEAKIEAEVWLMGRSEHHDYSQRIERTGNIKEVSEVYFLGLKIYSNVGDVGFSHYELEVKEEELSKNLVLPLKVKHYTYYETKEIIENKPFSEVESQKVEEAKQNALIYLQENEIIKNENYSVKSAAGITHVLYILTVSRQIGG